jgi:hypothetical protein
MGFFLYGDSGSVGVGRNGLFGRRGKLFWRRCGFFRGRCGFFRGSHFLGRRNELWWWSWRFRRRRRPWLDELNIFEAS